MILNWRRCFPSRGAEGACRVYVIAAMERCGFKPADIDRMMQELHEVFDSLTLDEAQRLYERSTY